MERKTISARVTLETKRMIKKVARRLKITPSRYIETVLDERVSCINRKRVSCINRRGGIK